MDLKSCDDILNKEVILAKIWLRFCKKGKEIYIIKLGDASVLIYVGLLIFSNNLKYNQNLVSSSFCVDKTGQNFQLERKRAGAKFAIVSYLIYLIKSKSMWEQWFFPFYGIKFSLFWPIDLCNKHFHFH